MQTPNVAPKLPDPRVPEPLNRHNWLYWVTRIAGIILVLATLIVVGVLWMISTPAGTRFLLDELLSRQGLVSYQYQSGDLRRGVTLTSFRLKLKTIDLTIDQARIKIGWRAVLKRELHFREAELNEFTVWQHKPPTGKPFDYADMRLPLGLHIDHATIQTVRIVVPTRPDTVLNATVLNDTHWQGTHLELADSATTFGRIRARGVTGQLDFTRAGSWPITATGTLDVPALQRVGIAPLKLQLSQNMRALQVRTQTNWTQPIALAGTVAPFVPGTPYTATLSWQQQLWPVARTQQLQSRQGQASIQGDAKGLALKVDTDLRGKQVPAGRYQLTGYTDFNALRVDQLQIQALQGQANLTGQLDWQQGTRWQLAGQTQALQLRPMIPVSAREYLPLHWSGPLSTTGLVTNAGWQVGVKAKLPSQEQWDIQLNQTSSPQGQTTPLHIQANWQQLRRRLPSLGDTWSPQGQAIIDQYRDRQVIRFDAEIATDPRTRATIQLPAGRYQGQVINQPGRVTLPQVAYQGKAGQATGQLAWLPNQLMVTPTGQRISVPRWQANLTTAGLDIGQFLPATQLGLGPFRGNVQADGLLLADRQIITIGQTNLTTRLIAQQRPVTVQGKGQVILYKQPGNQFDLRYQGQIDTPGVPTGPLQLDMRGAQQRYEIRQFNLQTALSGITAQGILDLRQGIGWQLSARLRNLNTGLLDRRLPGQLNGTVVTRGRWHDGQADVTVQQSDLIGSLKGQAFQATGALDMAFDPKRQLPPWRPLRFQANQFRVKWGNNQLTAQGDQQRVDLQVNAQGLQALVPGVAGSIQGQVQLAGQGLSDISTDLRLNQIRFGDFQLAQGTLQGTLPAFSQQKGQLTLTARGVKSGTRQLDQVQAQLTGSQQAHQALIKVQTGKNALSAQLTGGLTGLMATSQRSLPQMSAGGPGWQGTISQGRLQSGTLILQQDRAAALSWQPQTRQLQLGVHCWQMVGQSNSQACLTAPLKLTPQGGNLAVSLSRLDMAALRPFITSDVIWTGSVSGDAQVRFAPRVVPQLTANLITEKGAIGLPADDPQDPPIMMAYDQLGLKAKTVSNGIQVRFDAKTPSVGTGYIDAVIDPTRKPMTINGALVLDNVQMAVLRPLVPSLRELTGVASLAGGMSGPLTSPDFYGEFRLREGRLATLDLPLALSNLTLSSSIRGKQATINGTFNAGEGRGTLTGQAAWSGEPNLQFKVSGDRLAIRQPPLLTLFVNPDLDFDIWPTRKRLAVKGNVTVPRGVISPGDNDSQLVAKSADVRIIDETQPKVRQTVDAQTLARQQQILKAAAPWQFQTDVDVKLGNNVFFRGFGVNAALDGALAIRQRGSGPLTADGDISAQRNSQVELYGQTLDLARAIVHFDGPLTQPKLDIDANKRVERRLVGVRISGQPTNPRIQIYNDAGLTEQEALNALVTGRISSQASIVPNSAGFRSDVNNTLAAAGLSMGLGLSGANRTTNRIGRTLGLSGLTLNAEGAADDTRVNITGYITPDLYLRYGVGVFSSTTKLTLRYQVNRRLYVEASSAIEKAVDVFYNWRF